VGKPFPDLPELLGGSLCLDFVNTVHHRYRPASRDYLDCHSAWLSWSVHAGAVSPGEAQRLEARALSEPRLADRVFERALAFRSTAHAILLARVRHCGFGAALVADLDELLTRSAPLRILAPDRQGEWTWSWREDVLDLDRPLFAVAHSLAELLQTAPADRVKECPAPDGCGWFFLDETRNASRRWCSMKHCGTSSKVRRYAQKKKKRVEV